MTDTAESSSQSPVPVEESSVPLTPAKKVAKRVNKITGIKKLSTKPSHPATSELVLNAIKTLQDRNGSSLQAIKKFIASHYKLDTGKLAPFIKKYLKNAIVAGKLIQTKGKGASGSFKLPAIAVATKATNVKKKKVAKTPKAVDRKIKKSDGKKEKKKKEKSPATAIKTLSEKKKHLSLKKGTKKSIASIKSSSAATKQKSTIASKVKAPMTKKAPSVKKAASIGGTEKKAHKNAKIN